MSIKIYFFQKLLDCTSGFHRQSTIQKDAYMFLLPYFASSQIWLNCLNDYGNQCIITKLEKEHWFGPLNMSRIHRVIPKRSSKRKLPVFGWPIWWVIYSLTLCTIQVFLLMGGDGEKHNMQVVRNTYKGPNNHRCGIIPEIMRDFAPQHPPIRVAFFVLHLVTYLKL